MVTTAVESTAVTTDDMLFPSGMDENAAADDLNGALTGRDQTDIKTYQTQQGMGFGNNFSAADILKDRGVWGEDMFKPREEQGGTSIEVDPEEYFVGPGDKITVMIWKEGRQPNSYQVVVSQQAEMYVPYLGRIDCEGRNLAAVSRSVQAMVGKKLPSFHSQVVLTKTRTSRVSVLGGVKQPGDYLVDIPSRVTDLIALAGGLGSNGSIRNIEITGKNGAKQKIDLFKFYQSGNRTFNPYVSNGQIIYVAIQRSLSEIKGEVFRPGKYEIIEGETLKKLLEFAGGPTSSADLKRVTLKRYLSVEGADVAGERAESSTFDLSSESASAEAMKTVLKAGDVVSVYRIGQDKFGKISIKGAVRNPTSVESSKNMTVRELVALAGGALDDADVENIIIRRLEENKSYTIMRCSLNPKSIDALKAADAALRAGDEVIVNSIKIKSDHVTVEGFVKSPGSFLLGENMMLSDAISLAGGVLLNVPRTGKPSPEDVPPKQGVPQERFEGYADIFHAYIQRMDATGGLKEIPVDLECLIVRRDGSCDVKLAPNDRVVVPGAQLKILVRGAVAAPGLFDYEQNRDARYYAAMAGMSRYADATRVQVKKASGDMVFSGKTMVEPGDEIFVPERKMEKWTAYMQVMGNIALTLSGLSNIFQ